MPSNSKLFNSFKLRKNEKFFYKKTHKKIEPNLCNDLFIYVRFLSNTIKSNLFLDSTILNENKKLNLKNLKKLKEIENFYEIADYCTNYMRKMGANLFG